MRRPALHPIGFPAIALLVALAGCADSVPTDSVPEASVVTGATCPLTVTMKEDVNSWFQDPERASANKVMASLSAACGTGDPRVTQHAIDLLRGIEYMLDAGRGGDPVTGSRLANALLACITATNCAASDVPGLDFVGALSNGGLFAVRFGDSAAPAIARAVLPFIDFANQPNSARFGVELDQEWSWTAANGGSQIVLLYGKPLVSGGLNLQETGIGGLQYEFNRWPKTGPFASDNIVHVGVCFASEIELPDDAATGLSTQPRIQREGTLLTQRNPTFCAGQTQTASVFAPVANLTKSLLRSAGFTFGVKTPAIGGSALDFSRFAPVAANPNGASQLLVQPPAVVAPNASLGPITVRAASGGGTAIERVHVTVYILNNRGEPAGAVLVGNPSAFTNESTGTAVIDGLSIKKTGGYTLCARAELDGFSFQIACSQLFHVRK